MARNDLFEDLHDDYVNLVDSNGVPLFLYAIASMYYSKDDYERYIKASGVIRDQCSDVLSPCVGDSESDGCLQPDHSGDLPF